MPIATDEFENYKPGDRITITEGPLENYDAIVDELLSDRGLVRVKIYIFDREAVLELEPHQMRLPE